MHGRELQQIGLTEKEAKVYLAALTLGKATANDVSKKADLKRPTTYFTLDLLMEKGLVSSIHEGKKQYFMAESPDQLVSVYNKREDELRREGEKLKQIIPDLKKLRPKGEDGPVVKYYSGKLGVLGMVKDLLHEKDTKEIFMIFPEKEVSQLLSASERQQVRFDRMEQQIGVKALYTNEDKVEKMFSDTTESYLITDPALEVKADIAVFNKKVRITSFGDPVSGIVIEDADVAATLRTLIKLAMKSGK